MNFELVEVMDGSNWVDVTVNMVPDEITYAVITEDSRTEMQAPLTTIYNLYLVARAKSADTPEGITTAFDITETAEGILLTNWWLEQDIETTYQDLEKALQPLLRDIFIILDEMGNQASRKKALDFLSNGVDADAHRIHQELTS